MPDTLKPIFIIKVKEMFDYKEAVNNAMKYGHAKGFMPNDPNYNEICEWVKTLPERYRVRLHTKTVVAKVLEDDAKFDALIEFHHKSKLVTVEFCHKATSQ